LGPVFRAYDATRERLVAVKLFKLDLPPERVHQLAAEFERLVEAGLDHPALALPLVAGIVEVSAYLAQEYVAADALDSVVREYGEAPPADALRVAAQLAGALDFAAVVNIVHGTMHPRDILLSSDETRLTGVGVARALEKVGVAPPVRRPYTAPERVAGHEWDRRADVYSLAAVMHEMLWAKRPSGTGVRAAEALTEIEGGDLTALQAAFARGLAEDPEDRFETALEFAHALSAAFPHVVIAPPESDQRAKRREEPRLPLIADSDPESADLSLPPDGVVASSEPHVDTLVRRADEPAMPFESIGPAPADMAPERAPLETIAPAEVAQTFEPVPDEPIAPINDRNVFAPPPDEPLETDSAVLKREEEARYRDVESAPSVVAMSTEAARVPASVRAPQFGSEPVSRLERTRSAVWPLVLALGVGLAVGFASGYGVGTRGRIDSPPAASASVPTSGAGPAPGMRAEPRSTKPTSSSRPSTAGREFTENAVPAASKPPATPAPARPPVEPEGGRILVRSTPAGARVAVDGKDYGRTPVAVRELTNGAHRVRVTQEGYIAEERRVTITASRPAQSLTIPLSREPEANATRGASSTLPPPTTRSFAGSLMVDSRPSGAKVFVDGRLAGTTPLAMPDVRAGEHAIRIEREGYRMWSSSVRVVAAEQNRVTASLER
jgi:serine/threonine-protein kinase